MENNNNDPSDLFFQLDEYYLDLRDDGHSISFLGKKEIEERPYPGLRPFRTSEFQLFNGRDGQAEELISRLKKNKFLSVIGSSGTGKSSLVRAGLVPQLLAGYLYGAGTNWDVAICRPGKDPVENLAIALARTKCRSNKKEEIINQYNLIEPLLSRSIYGILDVNELLNPPGKPAGEKTNLLIVIDQFEELFRFNREDLGKPDIEDHFVNLFLKASLKQDVSIYVIITMRSEFLGDCVKYRGLPEAINEGQYLVPQLSRAQIKEVIEDPITLAGKKISPGLVELLVNEIEESKTKKDLDQLPILQHALMRTYQEAIKNEDVSEITYDHYLAAGGMENALANHAERKYLALSPDINDESFKQKITKIIFQALTDASTDQKKGRRPTDLKTLYNIAASLKATGQEVDEVINHFRDRDTSFIMPPINTDLYPELIMDISHESLMRQWGRLKSWVAAEAENGKLLIRLSDYQKQNLHGEKDFLVGKELVQISDWYRSFKPQNAWAMRYSQNHKESFQYLEKSEAKWKDSQKIAESERSRKILIYKILWIAAPGIIFLTAFLLNNNYVMKSAQEDARLGFLWTKRKFAVNDGNRLLALTLTTEGLIAEKKINVIDSILKKTQDQKLLPEYSLKNCFLNSNDIINASISQDGNTIFTWTRDGIFSEVNSHTGITRKIATYQSISKDTTQSRIIRTKRKLSFLDLNKSTQVRDTILLDSSIFYRRNFVTNSDIDEAGINILPTILRTIFGAIYYVRDRTTLTWGRNTESTYDAVDIWDRNGNPTGTSLIYDGINGVASTYDKHYIIAWGIDSSIKLWQRINNSIDSKMSPELFKFKMQVTTGVEMNEKDYSIKVIPAREYIKRRKEFYATNKILE